MKRPRCLDLFCGAGGAAMGLWRAGFDVVGVDIKPQPRYPFAFVRADALRPPFRLDDFDLVWASPPCQAFTQMSARWRGRGGRADSHPNLLIPALAMVRPLETLWVVENVVGARPLMPDAITLHGGMFGLRVHRPRLFASNLLILRIMAPAAADPLGVYGTRADGRLLFRRANGTEQRAAATAAQACEAMGMPGEAMDWCEVREAVPPAYSEHIGYYAMLALGLDPDAMKRAERLPAGMAAHAFRTLAARAVTR